MESPDKVQNMTVPGEQNHERENKSPLSEAGLLAIVSAAAYLFAFLYERGYTTYFGIPTQLINVSLNTLLVFGAATFTFVYFVVMVLDTLSRYMQFRTRYLAFYIPRLSLQFFLLVLVPLILFWGHNWKVFLAISVFWSFIILLFIFDPVIRYRKRGSWAERYDIAWESEVRKYPPTLLDTIGSRYGIKHFSLLAYILFLTSLLATMMGEAEALKQNEFLVLNTAPEMVVLRAYNDNMICAPFDRNTREVKKSFSIRKITEDSKLVMNLEKVGPLKPVDRLTSEGSTPLPTPTPTPMSDPTPSPAPSPTN